MILTSEDSVEVETEEGTALLPIGCYWGETHEPCALCGRLIYLFIISFIHPLLIAGLPSSRH